MLSEVAHNKGITIVGGSIPNNVVGGCIIPVFVYLERMENYRAEQWEDTFIFDDRQVHLFDINAPGDISFKEFDNFTSGDRPTVVDTVTNMSFSSTSQFGEIIEIAVHEETTVIAEVNYSMIPLR
ncbi:hypothetical protein IFM89_019313, partial [Coptis chinensis]